MAVILGTLGTFVATSLAQGAIGAVGGVAAGWGLNRILGDPNEEHRRAIQALGRQLSSVESAVKALGAQLSRHTAASVMLNALNPTGRPLPKADLVRLMNACDIGLTTAMGEGWGLGSFEHAATGAPQVVPDHTSFREIWPDGTAVRFAAERRVRVDHEAAEMFAGEPAAIAEALLTLLADPAACRAMGRGAAAHASDPARSWPAVAARFDRLIGDLLPASGRPVAIARPAAM